MRMIESSALDVLLARALETSALGTSGQAKDRLIVEALYGPAEPESETVVIFTVEVKLAVEGRGVFQEARVLLIVVAEARVDRSGVRNERQNFQRQGRQSYRSWVSWAREVRNYIVRERRAICGGCWYRLSTGVFHKAGMRRIRGLIRIIDRAPACVEASPTEIIPGHCQNVKLAA